MRCLNISDLLYAVVKVLLTTHTLSLQPTRGQPVFFNGVRMLKLTLVESYSKK